MHEKRTFCDFLRGESLENHIIGKLGRRFAFQEGFPKSLEKKPYADFIQKNATPMTRRKDLFVLDVAWIIFSYQRRFGNSWITSTIHP